jgi:hypothetical protein
LTFAINSGIAMSEISKVKASWVKARWTHQWNAAEPSRLHQFIKDLTDVPDQHLPRKEWTTLNHLRTGVGRFSAAQDPSQTV